MRAHIKAWLEILAAEPEADARYYALAQEFRDVPPTLVDDVLTEARRLVSPQTFNVLQSVATEQLAWVGLGDAALALARRIEDRAERSVALARLSAGLPAGERDAIVAEVLSSLSPEDGEERWVFGLGFLLPSLTLPQLLSLVRVTRGLRTPAVRARLQAGLLSYLPRCQRRAFGREVLHACRRCEPSDRARLVAALAFRLPYDLWSPLIDLASTDNKIGVVTATLAALASRTPTRLVRAWLDYMCTLPPDTPGRALLLASLAIRLPKSARQSSLEEACSAAIGTDEGDWATEALDILASHLPAQLLQAILAEPCISGKVCPGRASWRPLLPPCRNSRRPSGMRHGRRCSTGWRSENDAGSLAGFLISGLQSPISETRTPPVNSPMVCWRLLATGPEFADHSWDQFARAAVPWCRSAFRRAVPPDLRP